GEIELAPGESGMFTISGTVDFNEYPNLVQVTVIPANALAQVVVNVYEVYSKLPQAVTSNGLPVAYSFDAAYPNPFNPATHLNYALPTAGRVSLVIYDISGREVAHLIDEYQLAGLYKSAWNAGSFASGIYFARFKAAGFIKTQKVILMK
ncbi:MAG: T9SS type A sorting domain-containing protein, partial [Candidatus Marinimicrobia bacterium]|nr:T9SS type A sorting domain-containing protein [Candidatus Neomarinimicrobiota bacterium]